MGSIMSKNIEIADMLLKELVAHDADWSYQKSLSVLSSKYNSLHEYKTASKEEVDEIVLEATRIAYDAVQQADFLLKQSNFEKESSLLTKIVLKTLKVAQKMLAGLLLKNPLKVGIAYNAMHNVIKFLEKQLKEKIKKK